MTEQALRAALLKLQGKSTLPASQFTPAQRSALDRFARQTGAVSCLRQGRGDVYSVCDQAVFDAHVSQLSPQVEPSIAEQLPLRAQHVAHARDSKARRHQHGMYYPLLKAVGGAVSWHEADRDAELALSAATVCDTTMLKLQLPAVTPPGMTAPLGMVAVPRLMVPVMVVSADRVVATPSEKQVTARDTGLPIFMLVGNTSISAAVRVLVMVFGLVMTMVSVVVPTVADEVVWANDLLMVGALGSDTFCTWNVAAAWAALVPTEVDRLPAGMVLL